MKFYDTSSLLLLQEEAFKEPFMTSTVVFGELENIKVSKSKTEDVRYAARKVARLFDKYDNYTVVPRTTYLEQVLDIKELPVTNDNLIVATAFISCHNNDIVFVTDDILLGLIAKQVFGLTVSKAKPPSTTTYKGYTNVTLSDEEMADFYENPNENKFGLLTNEYLVIHNTDGDVVDKRKWDGKSMVGLKYKTINHDFVGKMKPINPEQELAFDLLQDTKSKIKVLTGEMGSGKTMLMIYNALQLIKNGKYKRLLWLRNTIEVKDTKPIGFLPEGKGAKLLPFAMDLADHCGGVEGLNKLIDAGIIEIEHLGFIRGRNISETIIIANEVENMTVEHIQLLIGRICEDSMLWLDGDSAQVDADTFKNNSGLESAIENLKGQSLFGYVELKTTERSEMAKLAKLLK